MTARVIHADSLEAMRELAAEGGCVHAVVCDPPYGLSAEPDPAEVLRHWLAGDDYVHRGAGFMGKSWDSFVPGPTYWRAAFDLLPPGGHLVAFAGTRTMDLMAMAIRLAGFEIRDTLMWLYGTGFPKSRDVAKAIDAEAGAEREVIAEGAPVKRMIPGHDQNTDGSWIKDSGRVYVPQVTAPATPEAAEWEGWGTALKPAWEPIILARKPLAGTVAANVLRHRTGAINVDACRVGDGVDRARGGNPSRADFSTGWGMASTERAVGGRWPANVLHDGSDEVEAAFAAFGSDKGAAAPVHRRNADKERNTFGAFKGDVDEAGSTFRGDTGTASRFFYSAKASAADRCGSKHPTVKPVALKRWLTRLVCPTGGTILDPFAGSGTTGEAALLEGFVPILIEREAEYIGDIHRRLARVPAARSAVVATGEPTRRAAALSAPASAQELPLFAAPAADAPGR